ncbi:MAG TPA: acyloxyacyl hydrolase, partial [Saprospiraceae bacterium]|nr:acyloxyacyl hydrolase [Saprospiraceae bacterium]
GCIVLLWFGLASGQVLGFETTLHAGAVWRHTPKLTTQTGELLWGQEFGVRFQTTGRRNWQAWQRYPILGAALVHFHLGDGSHGDGFGLLPNLSIPIVRSGWFTAFFRLGTGLAWVTQPYDYFDNPGENAIGSHWNNITQFRLGGEARLDDHFRLNMGVALNHFSNGASALPNLGVNLASGYVGLAWSPQPVREKDFLPAQSDKRAVKRFGGMLQAGFANIEYGVYDGPKYLVWDGTAAGYFHFNKINRILLGVDYGFNKAIYAFGLQSADFENEAEAQKGATRLGLFVADEFLFGSIGVQLQMGHYVGKELNQYVLKPNYSKLTLRGYFPKLFHTTLQPNLGITLKAHATTAEYISMNAGLAF